MAYPSPPFLLEPAHEGKPTETELPVYQAYFRYQVRRGFAVGLSGHATMIDALSNPRLTELQAQILGVLSKGKCTRREVATELQIDVDSVRTALLRLQARGLAMRLGKGPDTLAQITPAGRHLLTKRGEQTNGTHRTAGANC